MSSRNFLLEVLIQAKDQAGKTFDNLKGRVKGLFSSFTELSSAIGLANRALDISRRVIAETVDKTAEHIRSNYELSLTLGTTVEEASRLSEMADDNRISMEKLSASLAIARKNGFEPTIENLANLADELAGMSSSTEKAEKMQKIFGRGWKDLLPILTKSKDEILANAEAIDEALIVTQDMVRMEESYRLALDDATDAIDAQKYKLGNELLPLLTKALVPAQKEVVDGQVFMVRTIAGVTQAMVFQNQTLVDATVEYNNLKAAMVKVNLATKDADLIPRGLEELPGLADEAAGEVDELQLAMGRLNDQIGGSLSDDMAEFSDEQGELGRRIREVKDRVLELEGKKYLTPAQKEELANAKLEVAELDAAIREHAAAHEEATKRILFDILSRQAAMDGLTETEVQALTDIASSWGLIDPATKTAMEAASSFFGELQQGARLSQDEIDELRRKMLGLPKSHSFTVTTYKRTVVQEGAGGTTFETGGGGSGNAEGADFVVPPGFPNDSYPMRVESGERVIVMNKEQQRMAASRRGITAIGSQSIGKAPRPVYIGEINIFPPEGADAEDVAELVVAKLSQALGSGNSMIYAE